MPTVALALALTSGWLSAMPLSVQQGPPRIVAWNDLGMHCIDPDFSVFTILPPFNTVNAQVIVNGQMQGPGSGITVTYEGVADSTGSINTTSIGKTNFWDHVEELFGVALALDVGLSGQAMPGPANIPQPSAFDALWQWFQAEGIPFTPLDDTLEKNPFPLLRVTARNAGGAVIATTETTVPNSQELQCSICHASGASPFARPAAGWAFDPNPLKDDRWNILTLHDERHLGEATFDAALVTAGYDPGGLRATALGGVSVLCSRCHGSNALPGTGFAGITPLTQAMHTLHGEVVDATGVMLNDNPLRASCYTCHPGFETQCLRGAMGKAIGSDGQFAMQCQSCHGNQAAVGDPQRVGWLEEPVCQNCHTGTATLNAGSIRFTSAFDALGNPHQPASPVFSTTADVPAAGFSLYRFSSGHGGLQCSACHGPPHAIYPTSVANDNHQNQLLQGHVGTLTDCTVCHTNLEDNEIAGPHGMHPVTNQWAAGKHGDAAEHGGAAQCQACHGQDYRGTVLSYAQGDRTFPTQFGTKNFWRGFQVGCYACHNGPNSENPSNNTPPVVSNLALSTPTDEPRLVQLSGTDANQNPLTFRIVSQPGHGTVGLAGNQATYRAKDGYQGPDSFTYAAWDGSTNSNLGTASVSVGAPACPGTIESYGFGCPGSNDLLPTLSISGCPTAGGTLGLSLERGLGSSVAFLVLGRAKGQFEISPGCILHVDQIITVLPPLPLSAGGPGDGALGLTFHLDATIPSVPLTFQAFLFDPGVPIGYSATNGVRILIQ